MTTFERSERMRELMVARVRNGRCAYCGTTLPPLSLLDLARLCSDCLPLNSPGCESIAGKARPPSDAQCSYWVLEKYFGSFGLVDVLTEGIARRAAGDTVA